MKTQMGRVRKLVSAGCIAGNEKSADKNGMLGINRIVRCENATRRVSRIHHTLSARVAIARFEGRNRRNEH